jgi:hypothetical protein
MIASVSRTLQGFKSKNAAIEQAKPNKWAATLASRQHFTRD